MDNPHIGNDFDAFLKEEGIHEDVTAAAIKRAIAWQLEKLMRSKHITKVERNITLPLYGLFSFVNLLLNCSG